MPAARLELARPKSTDFKSVVSTDSTKRARSQPTLSGKNDQEKSLFFRKEVTIFSQPQMMGKRVKACWS